MSEPVAGSSQSAHAEAERRLGFFYGLGAYLWWGFIAVYLKRVATVPPFEVLSHRIVWSLILVMILIAIRGGWGELRAALRDRRTLAILCASTSVLAINWFVFIYAVMHGNVVEASLGYFITPLMNVVFGVVILREKLRSRQAMSVIVGTMGVAFLAWQLGRVPWIAFGLAATFGSYGLLRKIAPVASLPGLAIETAILLIPALLIIGSYKPHHDLQMWMLLAFSGVVTAVPLLLFAAAARRIRLVTMGFLQYLAPMCQFLLGVYAYGEKLTPAHVICFAMIWLALAIYSWDAYASYRAGQTVTPPAIEEL